MQIIFTAMLVVLIACENTEIDPNISSENQRRADKGSVDPVWLSQHQNDTNIRILDLGQTHQGY